MVLDPKKFADWEIAQDAETRMKTISRLGSELGLEDDELLPYGKFMGKVDDRAVLTRLASRPNGKYVDVTAITPTAAGRGQVHHHHRPGARGWPSGANRPRPPIRQPSGGPTMGVKGSAARGRPVPVHPPHPVFPGLHRRYQRGHERPQSGHGGPDLAHAARAQLRRRNPVASVGSQTAQHRPDQRQHGLGSGLLLPGFAAHRHRYGRPQRRLPDAVALRYCGVVRGHGHSGYCQGFARSA